MCGVPLSASEPSKSSRSRPSQAKLQLRRDESSPMRAASVASAAACGSISMEFNTSTLPWNEYELTTFFLVKTSECGCERDRTTSTTIRFC